MRSGHIRARGLAVLALVLLMGCQMVTPSPRGADPDEEPELICGNC